MYRCSQHIHLFTRLSLPPAMTQQCSRFDFIISHHLCMRYFLNLLGHTYTYFIVLSGGGDSTDNLGRARDSNPATSDEEETMMSANFDTKVKAHFVSSTVLTDCSVRPNVPVVSTVGVSSSTCVCLLIRTMGHLPTKVGSAWPLLGPV